MHTLPWIIHIERQQTCLREHISAPTGIAFVLAQAVGNHVLYRREGDCATVSFIDDYHLQTVSIRSTLE